MRLLTQYLIIIGLFVGCATTLPPSEPSKRMMDQADTILLKVDQTPQEAFNGFAQHLSVQGFGFETRDEDQMILSTEMKESEYFDFYYGFEAKITDTDSSTVITVHGKAQNSDFGEIEPENWGIDQSLNRQAWAQVRQLVESYPHQELFYQRM